MKVAYTLERAIGAAIIGVVIALMISCCTITLFTLDRSEIRHNSFGDRVFNSVWVADRFLFMVVTPK